MRKTVPQVTTNLELSITRAQHVPAGPITLYGINTNANRGPIAPAASTSLPTAQAAPTAPAPLAVLEHIPPPPTLSLAPRGQLAQQVKR